MSHFIEEDPSGPDTLIDGSRRRIILVRKAPGLLSLLDFARPNPNQYRMLQSEIDESESYNCLSQVRC